MTHVLEDLTHQMEGQPPKTREVSPVLGVCVNILCKGNILHGPHCPLAVTFNVCFPDE